MNNLFNFNYKEINVLNDDSEYTIDGGRTKSRFSVVFGANGQVVHCKKKNFEIIPTEALSEIGHRFNDNGYSVNTFTHRNGEIIGLRILLAGKQQTIVGEKRIYAIITIPQNGAGRGYLTIQEERLICTNGMTSKNKFKDLSLKVPHNLNYEISLQLMAKAIEEFKTIIEQMDSFDENLNRQEIDKLEAKKYLNEWFYDEELPPSQKKELTSAQFREMLALDYDNIPSLERYEELIAAFNKEQEYNKQLNLKMSAYTVFATVTNYLSRRREKSNSTAPLEVQSERNSKKLAFFDKLAVAN